MKKRGRKTLCTPGLTKQLCKLIAGACTIKTSCEACGVSEKSFHEWIVRGAGGEQPFSQFRDAVMRARGRFKARVCKSIIEDRDWRARLELLSRVYPEEFGRTEPRILVVQQTPPEAPQPAEVRYICTFNDRETRPDEFNPSANRTCPKS